MGDDHLLLQYPEGWWAPDQMRNGEINALPKNRGNWELTRLKKKTNTSLLEWGINLPRLSKYPKKWVLNSYLLHH